MLRLLDKIEEGFCALAILATALILVVNVILRYVFSASTSWAEELIKYLMIWIAFIGASICARQGTHIRMDFLLTYLPVRAVKILNVLVYAIAMFFCGVMLFYGIKMLQFNFHSGQVSPALKVPMWIPYASIPVGCGLMLIRFFNRLIDELRSDIDLEGARR